MLNRIYLAAVLACFTFSVNAAVSKADFHASQVADKSGICGSVLFEEEGSGKTKDGKKPKPSGDGDDPEDNCDD